MVTGFQAVSNCGFRYCMTSTAIPEPEDVNSRCKLFLLQRDL